MALTFKFFPLGFTTFWAAPENDVSKDEDEVGVTRGGYQVIFRYQPISVTASRKRESATPTTPITLMVLDMTQDLPSAQPRRQQSPASSPARTPGDSQDLGDDISIPFPVMNHESLTEPYNADQSNQADFEREVAEGIMRLMMNIRAWAEARPAHEATQEKERLISEIQQIESREREQGTSVPSFWGALASSIAP
ncbi:hypothetical protein RHS04_04671 [Rhizoctonia solani]|uniref:Uncharacterized protein n=1 Tax=Rhizoctonia solani TaxID=456999 RepID=A0A8H7H9D3_9AGAM|nr:hypothetical protein RHS04_04671 [Rhizoctonia solani]